MQPQGCSCRTTVYQTFFPLELLGLVTPEIQEHILTLAMYQHIRDMNKLTQRDEVHKELIEYHRLKRRWGLGHIKIILSRCGKKRLLHENMRNRHTTVLGHFLDRNNIPRREFLGCNLKDAHARLEYVKLLPPLFYR